MKKSTKRIILINLAAMIAVIVAAPLLTLNWLDSYTMHGKAIEVPDICGLTLDEGAKRLSDKLLGYEIVDYKYQKDAAENEILEQRPAGLSKVKKGRKIQLTLASNKEPTMALPDVIDNCSLREAEARLRAAGFKLTEHVTIKGEKDWVYSIMAGKDTLRSGAQVALGSTLTIVIGSGNEEEAEESVIVDDSWFE
jgi:beta-lactam-binding protein with PASTA domain